MNPKIWKSSGRFFNFQKDYFEIDKPNPEKYYYKEIYKLESENRKDNILLVIIDWAVSILFGGYPNFPSGKKILTIYTKKEVFQIDISGLNKNEIAELNQQLNKQKLKIVSV